MTEHTTVIVVGAGVAGLTLANMLQRNDIDCIILERRSREYVERRQRAGTVDTRGVRMFREWGLGQIVDAGGHPEVEGGFFIDGHAMPIEVDDDNESIFIPQQTLVHQLADRFLEGGGDLRYEADITLENLETPLVRYQNTVITGDYLAGCDGDRGVTRAAVPDGALTRFSREYPYAWVSALAAVPARTSGMGIHSRGLAGLIPRGTENSRLYLQCPVGDTTHDWPDERIWSEIEARFGTPVATGPIIDKQIVPLRSVVHEPMSHERLYLLGDAAHIVPPMSAKGIHLALFDAETFARGVIRQVREGDASLLEQYSQTCLHHVWNYQAFAAWITDLMHDAGDATYTGEFRRQIARAELQRQFESEAANRVFSELTSGVM
ncbi:4-hydroxybenzoate 3-monooxygenase [Kineosporia sp. NBRC 101731]|uniref:4-hydroxybenzoate 3-monooxygenase n=1 Tax=Kineosporia sp. NBRC 101731 TaxID=3032199 RepID=UPI0024A3C63F|nr:4-hydroxybenzoate 3-monooxygenase [Kineosporia sp. NBRC 101731]GLY30831.1 4-hydroxybenzoate 3-monooxygenase [Kineosporia sp. NBRC 101731]